MRLQLWICAAEEAVGLAFEEETAAVDVTEAVLVFSAAAIDAAPDEVPSVLASVEKLPAETETISLWEPAFSDVPVVPVLQAVSNKADTRAMQQMIYSFIFIFITKNIVTYIWLKDKGCPVGKLQQGRDGFIVLICARR